MADKASIQAREQRLHEDLSWARKNGSEKTQRDAQRRYDVHLAKHNPKRW